MGILDLEIGNLINSPEYFYCEAFKCRLSKRVCMARQIKKSWSESAATVVEQFEECQNCRQGKKIKEEIHTRSKKESGQN